MCNEKVSTIHHLTVASILMDMICFQVKNLLLDEKNYNKNYNDIFDPQTDFLQHYLVFYLELNFLTEN